MKKVATLVLSIFCVQEINAQHSIGAGFQGNYLLKRPKNIDVTSAGGASISYGYLFDFKSEWNISPQVALVSNRYVMDGLFFDKSGKRNFEVTPNDYKQSMLEMTSLKLPIVVNKKIIGDSKNAAYLGFGPYFEYILLARQSYKIGQDKYKENAPIDNRFQGGLHYEIGIKKSSQLFKNGIYLSFGMAYQMSDLLKTNNSYKMLTSFAKCSVMLN